MAFKKKVVEEPVKRDMGKAILELVNKMVEEKKVAPDVIFNGIEAAIQLAAERHFGVKEDEESNVVVHLDRATGDIAATHAGVALDPETLGRIAAQSAKQVMIQKIREAESDTVFNEYATKKGELIQGIVQRVDAGTAIVSLGKSEAILPRSEQIPGETHHVGERVRAVVLDVRRQGHRVKIVLSRCHPDLVKALFEEEIPEIQDRTIDIRAVAREAGYRSKVAVVSVDLKVDCVGACVGVRGSRIKNIIEEINGERIDIVRWNDSLQVLIPNALQPAQISEVFTYPRLGRAIVLVADDQLSLAIGRRGQNVRLASKLVGWDIEIMTHDELADSLERAERWFRQLPHVGEEQIQSMIEEGFLSYNELTFIDAAELTEFTGLPAEQADEVLTYAEEYADVMEQSAEQERAEADEAARLAAQEASEADAMAAREAADAARAAAAAAAAGDTTEGGEPAPDDASPSDGEPAAESETEESTEPEPAVAGAGV
jgi:N utilization substance protein A